MAIRNVSSKKTRAALTIFGIAIGIMTIVSLQAISNGTRNLLSEEMAKIFGGGVIITSKSPTSIADIPEELVDVLEANEDIEFATGIVVFATQIGTNVFPLYGVIPEKMSVIINIPIAEGRAVYANETDTILVGYTVARRLNVKVNDSLPISIPGGNSKVFKVVGVGAASSPERDSAIVMSLRAAQELLGVEGY
ncbi:MAG: ABC transporter permease, partial [Candidatus Methanomethylicaceae archaeon]